MAKLKNYENFLNNENNFRFSPQEGLNEGRSMAKYNSEEFKEMFSGRVLESNGQIDNGLVEKLHSYYEINMLLESKSKWFDDNKKANYLDCEQAVIIVKNSEAFVIEKKTFELMRSESTEWISEVESSPLIKEGFTLINEGFLSKAKDFLKKCGSFLKELLAPKSTEEWVMLVISLLAAAAGIAGAFVPGFTIVSGVLLALNGILHIKHGFDEIGHARHEVEEVKELKPIERSIAAYVKASPAFLAGGLGISMGVYDIGKGLTTALVNPAGAAASAGVKAAAETAMHTVGAPGGFVHHLVEDLIKGLISSEVAVKAIEGLAMGLLPVILHAVLKKLCPFLWGCVLGGADKMTDGIEFVSNLPGKVSKMIGDYQEFAKDKGWFNIHTILSKGLGLIVKPVTDKLNEMSTKWIKPALGKMKEFIQNQMMAADIIKKHGLEEHIEKAEKEKPMGVTPIGEDKLKPVLPEGTPTEKVAGQAKQDNPENEADAEEAKKTAEQLAKQAGQSTEGGEKKSEEGGEKKQESTTWKKTNWKYLVEYNKFNK